MTVSIVSSSPMPTADLKEGLVDGHDKADQRRGRLWPTRPGPSRRGPAAVGSRPPLGPFPSRLDSDGTGRGRGGGGGCAWQRTRL